MLTLLFPVCRFLRSSQLEDPHPMAPTKLKYLIMVPHRTVFSLRWAFFPWGHCMRGSAEGVLYSLTAQLVLTVGVIFSLNSFVTLEGMPSEHSDSLTYNMSLVLRCPVPWPWTCSEARKETITMTLIIYSGSIFLTACFIWWLKVYKQHSDLA